MSPAKQQAVVVLHNAGYHPRRIAQVVEVGIDAVLRIVDPEYQQRRCEAINRNRPHSARDKTREIVVSRFRPSPELLKRLLAAVPADTRDVTAALLGDPLPGRSALDKRRAAGVVHSHL